MEIDFNVEYELVKEVNYNIDTIEPVEEYTFIVPAEWFSKLYKEHIVKMFDYEDIELDEFLNIYDPEVEGTAIYYLAKEQNVIIEEGWSEVAEY